MSEEEVKKSYVYIGHLKGVCVYVGEGMHGRWEHLNSGVSHVYQANRCHFSGRKIDIEILDGVFTKTDAVDKERSLIKSLKPTWNVKDTGMVSVRKSLKKLGREFSHKTTHKFKFLLDVADCIQDGNIVLISNYQSRSRLSMILFYWNRGDKILTEILTSAECISSGVYKFKVSDIFLQEPRRFFEKVK